MALIRRLLLVALALVALPLHAQTFNLFKPANGILKGQTTTYVTTAAASSDVITLFSGTCNSSSFLRGDGACAAVSASPGGSNTQLQYNNSGAFGGTTGLTWSGTKLTTPATAVGSAGLNLPHGTAPTSPVNGDLWTTTAGLFARINGSTVGPYSAGGGGGTPGGADTNVQFNNMGSFGGSADFTWDGAELFVNGSVHATSNSTFDFDIDVAGQVNATGDSGNYKAAVTVENNDPRMLWYEDDASSNQHAWEWGAASNVFNLWACDDGGPPTCNPAITVARSGATPTTFSVDGIDMTPQTSTFTVNFDSACTTTPSVTFNYYVVGPLVTIAPASTSGFPCTGDSANFSTTSADVPAALRPSTTAVESGIVVGQFLDAGANAAAAIYIDSSGHMLLLNCTTVTSCAATWTASGNRSWVISTERASFTYYKH